MVTFEPFYVKLFHACADVSGRPTKHIYIIYINRKIVPFIRLGRLASLANYSDFSLSLSLSLSDSLTLVPGPQPVCSRVRSTSLVDMMDNTG